MTSYSDKLKDPRWQKKRLQIFRRDDFQCRCCGNDKEALHAHHLIYIRGKEPWDYARRLLITLCETCHAKAHSGTVLSIRPNRKSPREMGTNPRALRLMEKIDATR
jgi:5-methylcytosine-specific restriction endonuclease McrA